MSTRDFRPSRRCGIARYATAGPPRGPFNTAVFLATLPPHLPEAWEEEKNAGAGGTDFGRAFMLVLKLSTSSYYC